MQAGLSTKESTVFVFSTVNSFAIVTTIHAGDSLPSTMDEGSDIPKRQPSTEFSSTSVPEAMVRLESGDGFTFTIDADYARVSPVIDAMLSSSFRESHTRVIQFPHVRGCVLELACQYFYYVARHRARLVTKPSIPPASHSPHPPPLPFSQHTNSNHGSQLPTPSQHERHIHTHPSTMAHTPNQTNIDISTFCVPPHLAVDLFLLAKYLNL